MKKIIIVGASIAGSAIAYLLAKSGIDITVYEAKKRSEIGKKLCANVVSGAFRNILKELDIDCKNLITNKYNKMNFFSKNNSASFSIEDCKIDREKFVETMIRNAERRGATFNFETSFIDLKEEKNKNIALQLKNKSRKFSDRCDILIGADGALSEVAKKAGLWQKRRNWLCLQAKVKRNVIKNKEYIPKKNEYNMFIGEGFGYYSYIFSSQKESIIGLGDLLEQKPAEKFANFLKFLGIDRKNVTINGALIPEPRLIKNKRNILLIGDAACQIKFNGGGIVPSLLSAIAVRDIIVKNDYSKNKKLKKSIFLNKIVGDFLLKFLDKDWDYFIDIIKDNKFRELPKNRDNLRLSKLMKLLNPKVLKFVTKKIF